MYESDVNLSIWHARCLEWQECDLEGALACFTFVADVTALAANCRFAGDDATLVARYDGLPFAAISFYGEDVECIAALTRELLAPGEEFWCLVGQEQWPLVQTAYRVLETHEEWQMLFRGDPAALDPGAAFLLGPADLPEMAALARREGMMAFGRDPLARGPWHGVRRAGALVAQGGTHFIISRVAEIGNIVTAREHRRQGYASQVVAALVQALYARGLAVFLQVFKDNAPAAACYERLGFERLRTMHLARCRLETNGFGSS
jgi:ribosomal protein S18 acetylase RimI-like enzyme